MGIGNTMKSMFKDENQPQTGDSENASDSRTYDPDTLNDSNKITNSNRASHKLPTGTGPGTTGKPNSETAMENDLARSTSGYGAAGYGTDAAAATGGSLAGTHQSSRATPAGTRTTNTSGTRQETHGNTNILGTKQEVPTNTTSTRAARSSRTEPTASSGVGSGGHSGVLDDHHAAGHKKQDVMPSGDALEDTAHLTPVVHEHVRHLETEEIERVKERDRHIHHVQHHTQPIVAHQELPERHKEYVHPVTEVRENHANKVEDNKLLKNQVNQHRDSVQHEAKQRTIIDKGTTVHENVQHHVHHVIQPVIEKETVERESIHTTIPIHEVTEDAPIVHQSQMHAPIPMEYFVEHGGSLRGGVSKEEISSRILHTGECTRDVNGVAEQVENNLHLHDKGQNVTREPKYIKTKVTERTTTTVDPETFTTPSARN
ncbi:hypothetical protein FA15DRAFT_754635 [Coprinopsis marcescibilis]|uniref:Allergen n=1 Tax=Coprinopsis marcescibilis TaxID=230819 RepID=A0A5C3L2H3_COPMA|nr:hypothetical protein FA15DRAFT_754635 [Coprinopsis marcescibilis]